LDGTEVPGVAAISVPAARSVTATRVMNFMPD
jgi:hypothetical protein